MKKMLSLVMIIIISISFIGCQKEEVPKYDFEYKFNEEYSDKINKEIALAFLIMVEEVVEIYDTAIYDFEILEIEEDFTYATSLYLEYDTIQDTLNEQEKELLHVMLGLAFNPSSLRLLKLHHANDEINKEIGLKTENTEEYYEQTLEEAKGWLEKPLDMAKEFIY